MAMSFKSHLKSRYSKHNKTYAKWNGMRKALWHLGSMEKKVLHSIAPVKNGAKTEWDRNLRLLDVSGTLTQKTNWKANRVQTNRNLSEIEFIRFTVASDGGHDPQCGRLRLRLKLRTCFEAQLCKNPLLIYTSNSAWLVTVDGNKPFCV